MPQNLKRQEGFLVWVQSPGKSKGGSGGEPRRLKRGGGKGKGPGESKPVGTPSIIFPPGDLKNKSGNGGKERERGGKGGGNRGVSPPLKFGGKGGKRGSSGERPQNGGWFCESPSPGGPLAPGVGRGPPSVVGGGLMGRGERGEGEGEKLKGPPRKGGKGEILGGFFF